VTRRLLCESRILGFVFKNWSGARDLNPGPHGPELCDIPSRHVGNDRFQFESFIAANHSVQICSVFPTVCYMKYYMNRLAAPNRSQRSALAADCSSAKHVSDTRHAPAERMALS
jgi:hypothetical protein